MPLATSNRALAKALGVSEKAVRKAEASGRIKRGPEGSYDVDECRKAWSGGTDPARSRVRTSTADHQPRSAPSVRTATEAQEAVALIGRVLADEGIMVAEGEAIDFALARLAETILKARQRDLAIAERKRKLVSLAAVTDHVSKAFVGYRQTCQQMPARHAAAMAAELGCDASALTVALDKMIAATLAEM